MADDDDKAEPGEDQPQVPAAEQLRVQTELAREEEEHARRTAAPPGKDRQLLVVMRHGERIDEVWCNVLQLEAGQLESNTYLVFLQLQVDKAWSALAKRPYDPFLSDHGQDQVRVKQG